MGIFSYNILPRVVPTYEGVARRWRSSRRSSVVPACEEEGEAQRHPHARKKVEAGVAQSA
jgi:hypothetical protein